MKPFDEHFIQLCRKGDRKAQKQLFETYYSPLFRICMRYINQQADAEDCLMRGFMKAFQKLDQFKYEGEHSLYAWIRKIIVNESLMAIRRKSNFMLMIEDEPSDIPLPSQTLEKMDAEELFQMIISLPTGYRTVFSMNVIDGYDHKEIAGMLGISESTSRTQLAKAKNKLREMIEQNNWNYGKQGKQNN